MHYNNFGMVKDKMEYKKGVEKAFIERNKFVREHLKERRKEISKQANK